MCTKLSEKSLFVDVEEAEDTRDPLPCPKRRVSQKNQDDLSMN